MSKISKIPDLIKTIQDDEDVEDFSEDSDVELENHFQPTKEKKKEKDFNTDFQFVSSVEEYNKDEWNDLMKYVKRKAKTKTDDKIKKVLAAKNQSEIINNDENEANGNDDICISDDELVHDNIKNKDKKKKKKNKSGNGEEEFFEDVHTKTDGVTFYEMNLSRPLMKAIVEMKYVHPTPIQSTTIPIALLGRDICGCAATGTGKTAAYMLPTLERLLYRPVGTATTRVLVLVPTRELGVQVYQVSKQLTQFTDIDIALSVGGLDLKTQENILRKNPDIVIATPGRLIDHLKSTPGFSLESIEILILDEADRMLDEFFAEQMKEIIKQCSRTRQTLLFSATMSDEVEDLAAVSLTKPVRVFVDSNKDVAFNLRQEFIRIRKDKESDREPILSALVCRTFRTKTIIFVQTKKQAHRLHILLGLLSVKVAELHGNLTQPQRLDALEKFKNEKVDVLIATDVAARGLDIPGVQTVINFMMPPTLEHYIHRVGRTARAGRVGVSVSLAGEQERKVVKEVIKRATRPVKSRIIPLDVLEKYKNKLEKLEPEIELILKEENEERILSKTENQVNRAQKLLNGEKDQERPWFQTKRQRKDEKERLSLNQEKKVNSKTKSKNKLSETDKGGDKNDKKKKTKKVKDTAEDRVQGELKKLALLQAKLAKKKTKPKKINAVYDNVDGVSKGKKRKRSNFADELCDTSRKGVKKFRHQGNLKKKGQPKKNVGKTFGRPQSKKQRN
ncbi:probable ATP-dependent RNA helicase DDX27 [Onthophagus taurus]|uniref:probable ATP-dependent RNA helicase DDX27 n=1 Tax=Onthophagus taurus TaxID=166361 RepID=UPI0039BE43AF